MTDQELLEEFAGLLEEATLAYLNDPSYIIAMIEHGRKIRASRSGTSS